MDIYQSERLYVRIDDRYRWLTTPDIAVKVVGKDWEKGTRIYLADELLESHLGLPITDWPEPEKSSQRNMSILWMGDEHWTELGGTHIIGFHEPCRPDWYPPHPIKLVSYLKMDSFDDAKLKARVEEAKNHPNNGGWWTIRGHEPDAQPNYPDGYKTEIDRRIEEYEMIRAIDTDPWEHPVICVMDMTGHFNGYPGWDYAFTGKDHDVFFIDCYASDPDGSLDVEGIETGARLVEIGLSRSAGQFIPCISAFRMMNDNPPPVVEQFDWWNSHFGPLKACAFWSSGIGQAEVIGVYEDERIAEEVKEVNKKLGLL